MNIIRMNDGKPDGTPATGMAKKLIDKLPQGSFGGWELGLICRSDEFRPRIKTTVPERVPGVKSSVLICFDDDTYVQCIWHKEGLDIEVGTAHYIPAASIQEENPGVTH